MLPPRWQRLVDDLRRREESESFDEDLARALTLDRFVVLDRIGAGGMGAVFEAIDPRLDRTVALKLCTLPSDDAARMIEHEARCLAQLAHPNVVTVYDVVREGPDLILVMEFVRGQTLRAWQRASERGWRAILDRYLDAARGLAAAHEQELEHGDFKPDNVVVGDDGRVRVIDFGIARHAFDLFGVLLDEGLEHEARGTRAYMAPERLRAERGGPRSDVFGFCVSVWESLYGARPYPGETTPALLAAIEAGQPRKGRALPGVPAAIEALLRRGIAEDPSSRPASVASLIDELIQARDAQDRRQASRRRWAWRGSIGLVWLAVAIGTRQCPDLVEPEPLALPDPQPDTQPEPQPDPVTQTLALAVEAMGEGLPDSAIQYLELARKRAHADEDEAARVRVADQAEALGDEFALQGDKVRAQLCWEIAVDIFVHLPDRGAATQRLEVRLKAARSR